MLLTETGLKLTNVYSKHDLKCNIKCLFTEQLNKLWSEMIHCVVFSWKLQGQRKIYDLNYY